jgi:predicted aldo/keto reductase-like oxidoreductase
VPGGLTLAAGRARTPRLSLNGRSVRPSGASALAVLVADAGKAFRDDVAAPGRRSCGNGSSASFPPEAGVAIIGARGTPMSDARLRPRPFGATGLSVTPLGLAELLIPHSWRQRRLGAAAVERAFHEHGINTFLLGPRSSRLYEGVRRLIRSGHRDELVLAAGTGLPIPGAVRRVIERHLRSLGTDHLDVWLLGYLCRPWYVRESVWTAMLRLREEGRTRALAFSSHDRRLAARLVRELPADAVMVRYNAAHRGAEREVFAALEDLGERRPGVIAYTATSWGTLLRPQPRRGFAQPLTGPECYRFSLGPRAVDLVWCAAGTPEELRQDVLGALAGPLPEADRRRACAFGDALS